MENLKHVIIIAATNRPDIIDQALLRPGRFDHLIYVPPPDEAGRREIFKIRTKGMPVNETLNIETLVKETAGHSGAEICLICREAGLSALSRDLNAEKVLMSDFEAAMKKVSPRLTASVI